MTELEILIQAIAALEAQRPVLGDAMVDAMLAPAREKLAALQAQPAPLPPAPTEQRKHVTVLFADVSGFTALSETLDAEDVRDTMNALWAKLDGVITAHGGKIDKHIGDAVMALWGTETAREDDAEWAIKAALAMQKEIGNWRSETNPNLTIAMRIGLNTGPVLLGAVGSTKEFTAMGDTVNVASRLEHAAPVGGILIAHDTYRYVRGVFDVLAQPPLTVKGKAEPLQVYLVERLKPRAFRSGSRGVEGVETPMVGRAAEMAHLQAAWRVVLTEQRMQTVFVVAEAGLGKSRLLYEFQNWMDARSNLVDWVHFPERRFWLFRGRATQATRQVPYSLLRDVLFQRFQIQEDEPLDSARAKLVDGVRRFLPADPKVEEKAYFLGYLVGMDFSTSAYLSGILHDAPQIRNRAFHYLTQLFAGAARLAHLAGGPEASPVALYLDDVHWADEGSLAAFAHLAKHCRTLPLLMLGLTRPTLFEQQPEWGPEWLDVRVELTALAPADARGLVDTILCHAPAAPETLRAQIVMQAEGNPFYLEEIIKMMIDEKVLCPAEPEWKVVLEHLTQLHIPPTLTGVLQARLDSLPPIERETLQRASVIGRVFWAQAVAALTTSNLQSPDSNLQSLLTSLHHRELIFPHATSAFADMHEYLFKHALLREVAYETVLKKLRRIYHAQAAAWLVAQSGMRADEFAALIAEHYELAGDMVEAARWYGRAGGVAQAAYANAVAQAQYTRQLKLLTTPREQVQVMLKRGVVLEFLGRWDEAEADYHAALALSTGPDLAHVRARSQHALGVLHRQKGSFPAALDWLGQARAAWETLGDQRSLGNTLTEMANVYWRTSDYAPAATLARAGLALSRAAGDQPSIASALNILGAIAHRQGDYAPAHAFYTESLALRQVLGDKLGITVCLNNLGLVAWVKGDHVAAQALHAESLALKREIGDKQGIAVSLNNLGLMAYEQQDYPTARALYEESLTLRQIMGDQRGIVLSYYNLGVVAVDEGAYARAWESLTTSLRQAQTVGDKRLMALDLAALASLAVNTGTPQRAAQLLAAAEIGLATIKDATSPSLRRQFDHTLAAIRAALDEAAFNDAWAAGTKMTFDEAVPYALQVDA